MTESIKNIKASDLPAIVPIFPLSGVLLLPRGRLPLNVFEPRYLNMTRDALAGERIIGLVQPLVQETQDADARPPVYATGCAGRITSFSENDDGRLMITLTGVARFEISKELPLRLGYRRAAVTYEPYLEDLGAEDGSDIDRSRLLTAVRGYFDHQGIAADWEAIEETSDERLITGLSMICPFAPSEKQALLESHDVTERCRVMIALMEMSLLGGSSEGVRH